jgi:small subunit ribosomal protein S9
MPTKKEDTKDVKETKEVKKPKKTLARADRSTNAPKKETEKAPKKSKEPAAYKLPTGRYHYANGKRKTSVARVRLYKGDGDIYVNEKPLKEFANTKLHKELVEYPLKLTGYLGKFTITAKVVGGGPNSQAEAVRHGIAKGLLLVDENLKQTLRQAGLLTRDPRTKERKKCGLKRARKAPQFSKR